MTQTAGDYLIWIAPLVIPKRNFYAKLKFEIKLEDHLYINP
jgi:hypothetical protein